MASMNDALLPNLEGQTFSFIVAGHIYGNPGLTSSVFPAASFCANVPSLNRAGLSFIVLLGDAFRAQQPAYIRGFRSVMRELAVPVFNAPGNHEGDRGAYESEFGPTYGEIQVGPALLIFLDTDSLPGVVTGVITGQQLEFLVDALGRARYDESVDTVLIFSHRLIWAPAFSWCQVVAEHVNDTGGYSTGEAFREDILPQIEVLSSEKRVYWLSGDIGCSWSLQLFWHRDEESGITFGACGLGDTAGDSVIEITVDQGGQVTARGFSLSEQTFPQLDEYGIAFWEDRFPREEETEKVRGALWAIVAMLLGRRSFYAGIGTGILLAIGGLAAVHALRRRTS